MSSYPEAPITCHVLNTVTGQPASGIKVILRLTSPLIDALPLKGNKLEYYAVTNDNGRVAQWQTTEGDDATLQEAFGILYKEAGGNDERKTWTLTFSVGDYFKGEGWWDDVDVRFVTDLEGSKGDERRKHWHVPLLLSPYSYTTYRGS